MKSLLKKSAGQIRLDQALVERGLAESRHKARAVVMAGNVRVNGRLVDKPSALIATSERLDVIKPPPFVSRGGEKLDHAMRVFGLEVAGLFCLDVGSSTGGFTDCLLQRGAARVAAVDVGKGQLHHRLREDERVLALEGVNARYLSSSDLPEQPGFACVDVSFISLAKVLPAVSATLCSGAIIVTLIKPQFEAGRNQIGRGGVVRDPAVRAEVVEKTRRAIEDSTNLAWMGMVESPLLGPAGNVEFLVAWRKP